MPFVVADAGVGVGFQDIHQSSDVQNHPLGTVVSAFDSAAQGGGEFIYLQGVASAAVGDAVGFNNTTHTAVRTVAATRGPVGVAMSANLAGNFGWYQVEGLAIVRVAASGTVGARPYLSATAGQLTHTVVVGQAVDGAIYTTATNTPATGFAYMQITRPAANGNG
jgi:hypothetical protein